MRLPPFQALVDKHREDVYRYLLVVAGPGEAEDAFQETWIAALRAYPRLERADNLRAWLLRIAHNKAMDAHRSRARRPLPVSELPEATAPASSDGEPELLRSMRELPPKQRVAVFCRSLLGMSYAELALLLDCSQDAARRNVHEGHKRLREELQGERDRA